MRVIGLMSGTSLDGIDACLVDVFGAGERLRWHVRHAATYPLPADVRDAVLAALAPGGGPVRALAQLDVALGQAFAAAAAHVAAEAELPLATVDLIGSHGQTTWHEPGGAPPTTQQLGSGAVIATATGVTTVTDFRMADVALGGQGAPLVPYVDRLLFAAHGGRVAVQNMGGIGNVTYLGPGEALLAFDTGPGNRVIDEVTAMVTAGAQGYDVDGRLAAAGRVDEAFVAELLRGDPFLALRPPKSTGREHYSVPYVRGRAQAGQARGLDGADLVATHTAYTAATVADAYRRFLPGGLEGLTVYVCGGGASNPTLMRMLAERLAPATVASSADAGVDPDHKEALAFAILAYQAVHGRPTSLPAATGGREPWVLGAVWPGRNYARTVLAPRQVVATEQANPASVGLDMLTPREAVDVMHEQDWQAVWALGPARASIADLIEATAGRLAGGGRLFYVGAGTSGRLGVLDASECPPTFSAPPSLVQALIAGGEVALTQAVEGAEDDDAAGAADLRGREVGQRDVVVGISANGGAPYVRGALAAARAAGALTALVTCNPPAEDASRPDHLVVLPTGPELVAGSTRLKAGTATKLALNMVSTLTMVALGKVHDNLMVDVRISNRKLRARAEGLVRRLTGLDAPAAGALLDQAGERVKVACVMHHRGVDALGAEALLASSGGRLRPHLGDVAAPVG